MDISELSQDECNAVATALQHMARRVLLGDTDAHEWMQNGFVEANIAWERQAIALIALLMLPSTTLEGAREFMGMAFVGPLLRLL